MMNRRDVFGLVAGAVMSAGLPAMAQDEAAKAAKDPGVIVEYDGADTLEAFQEKIEELSAEHDAVFAMYSLKSCGYCRMLEANFVHMPGQTDLDFVVLKIDAAENRGLAEANKQTGFVPETYVYSQGEPVSVPVNGEERPFILGALKPNELKAVMDELHARLTVSPAAPAPALDGGAAPG